MMKFRERFMMGEVPFDDIFSLTDKWNFSDEACTLREYLGLTAKEEDVWISDSDDALEELMEKEKNTKAVFLDLDGTLFTDEKTFSAGNCQAIEKALAAGHHIVISTGRPLASAIMQAKELGFTKKGCFVISFNGGSSITGLIRSTTWNGGTAILRLRRSTLRIWIATSGCGRSGPPG